MKLETRARKDPQGLQDSQERPVCQGPREGTAAQELQDRRGPRVTRATQDRMDYLDHQGQMASMVSEAQPDPREKRGSLGSREDQEPEDPQGWKDLRATLVLPVSLELLANRDLVESRGSLANLVSTARRATEGYRAITGPLVSPV